MKIKDLKEKHPQIYKRALECQVEQGNEENEEIPLDYSSSKGNFFWSKTKEGFGIWNDVYNGKFNSWYKFEDMIKDTKRLDALQTLTFGYGKGWILRDSSTNRGLRLHESSKEEAVYDIRDAIDNYLNKVK